MDYRGLVAGMTIAMTTIAFVGCSGPRSGLAAGATCTRTTECGTGLVCNMGLCTSDLTGFGMGTVPNADGGTPMDAAIVDMDAGEPVDTGPPVDAYVPPGTDAFVPPVDAFTPPVDAFTPPVDAFTPPVDAFTPPVDAFTPPEDAAMDEDAGP